MPPEERRPVTEDGEATSTTQEPAAAAAARAHELEEVGPTSATRRLESWRRFLSAIYSAPDCEAEYCDERVRLSVCVCVCLRSYLRNYTSDLRQILSARYLWQWLGPPPL